MEFIGEGASVNPNEVIKLATFWLEADMPTAHFREEISQLIEANPLNETQGILRQFREQYKHFLSAPESAPVGYLDYLIGAFEQVIKKGNMVIARENGKPIGMIYVTPLEQINPKASSVKPGDTVLEIKKALVLPEARGQGVYRKLREKIMEHVQHKYAGARLLSATKSEAVKKLNREMEWKEIGIAEYLKIHGATDEQVEDAQDPEKDTQKQGWTAFLGSI